MTSPAENEDNSRLLEPWQVALIIVGTIVGLVIISFALYAFVNWIRKDATPVTIRTEPKLLDATQKAWVDLGLGPALNLGDAS